jgi:hypothetical protein
VFSPPIVMSATPGSEAAVEQMRAMQERQRTLMHDPAYRAAMLAQQRNSLRTMNENVGRALGLSTEQSGKLLDLLAEQQLRMQEVSMDDWAEQNNDPADVADRMRKYQEISDQQERELKVLLGATGYRNYQEYQATLGARQQVNQLNMALASAGVPLTKEQVEPLTRALHQSQTKALQAAARDQQRWASIAARPTQVDMQKYQIDMMREQNKQMRAAASSVLNDEQMDAYMAQQEREVEGMEAYLHLVQAQADAVERGVVPPMPGSEDAIGFNHVYTSGATAGFVSTP